jgi:lipoic acid synthetase
MAVTSSRKPSWLKVPLPSGSQFTSIKKTLRKYDLHTVCEEANCPNIGECWSGEDSPGTATFMLMGGRCSRACNFCNVTTGGMLPLDPNEPLNIASAISELNLKYVVLTSVNRDDLPDQGAGHFAKTIKSIRKSNPETLIETLIPDFQCEPVLLDKIISAKPDVIAHNIETVERLQWPIRDRRAGYEQSLSVLDYISSKSTIFTKSSLMLGLGEYDGEVYQTLSDLKENNVVFVTLGQYLQPSHRHLDVFEYIHPIKFDTWKSIAEDELGFLYCASGPLVRSSYKAGEFFVRSLLSQQSSKQR